jgi:phage regulator Rha-like protein
MGSLVKLYDGEEARISTVEIFALLGYLEHRTLKRVISDNEREFLEYGLLHLEVRKPVKGSKGGRPDESYLLNEDQFILLVILAKNSKKSIELKVRVAKEFKAMKNALARMAVKSTDWQQVRKDGKAVYHQKTDIIKSFVEYATEQGSQSAKMYYTNLAKMENQALFLVEQKYPNLREVLNIKQLMQVATADQVVEKALQDGMDKKLPYKEIYQLAKERITQFSNIIGKSQVIALLEQDKQVGLPQ